MCTIFLIHLPFLYVSILKHKLPGKTMCWEFAEDRAYHDARCKWHKKN